MTCYFIFISTIFHIGCKCMLLCLMALSKQAVASRDGAVAEQQRLSESKDHEVKRLTELLARSNKELDSTKEFLHVKDETLSKLEGRIRELTSEKSTLETDMIPVRVDRDR